VWNALTSVIQPESFLFWPFILSTVLIAALAWRYASARGDFDASQPHWKEFFRRYFGRELWWHRSARIDYAFYFANAIIFPLLIGPWLFSSDALADMLMKLLGPAAAKSAAPGWGAMLAYTVVFFVAYDLARFVAHSLLHDVPGLWQFHKVHHSAEVLTPITSYRFHPIDLALTAWTVALFTALVTWLFQRYVDGGIGLYTFLGTHVLLFAFNLIGNLNHWQVWVSYGPRINRWVISPAHHQLHHSLESRHIGCNRGFNLAVWDRLYGTLYIPPVAPEKFRMGLGDGSDGQWHGLWRLYAWPFMMLVGYTPAAARKAAPAKSADPAKTA